MIENSERGITLNKTLAWGMLLSLVSAVWFGGTTVADLQASTENLDAAIRETREVAAADRRTALQIEARVRALETNASRQDARFDALRQSLDEVKAGQQETNELLRRLIRAPSE
ncbi:hypothetical protein [Jannaschia formosa]|uniref:hypothetical protein n=1 Tax=Jannaschia formosa TaxID=2259592 RepID=UPI000E1BF5F8|nr:hypothetical protein [Jannaschia formosa]TFL16445.1 hypothetical protein DR046_20200 [Jannaschia formosa]